MNFPSHTETAQAMASELQLKTNSIILLSHLGYGKEIELTQMIRGINIISEAIL